MTIYYYITNSYAAPFVSDKDMGHIEAESAINALKEIVKNYTHPRGLYAAIVCKIPSEEVLAQYMCSVARLIKERRPTSVLHTYRNGKEVLELDHNEVPLEDIAPLWEDFENQESEPSQSSKVSPPTTKAKQRAVSELNIPELEEKLRCQGSKETET